LERNIERQICSNWSNRFGHHAAFEAIRFNASKPTIKTSSKLKSRQLTVAGTCTRPVRVSHRWLLYGYPIGIFRQERNHAFTSHQLMCPSDMTLV
jgi:hypothetical protein